MFRIQSFFLFMITLIISNGNPFAVTPTGALDMKESDHVALLAIKSKIVDGPQGALSPWNDSFHYCQWEGVTCGRRHRRVTSLDLSSRGLSGSLSPFIGNLSFLREIKLQNNTLQGTIPPEVGRLFRLEKLVLYNNSFEGSVPATLSNCTNLKSLWLANNKLLGTILHKVSSLLKLVELVIQLNKFTGGIPSSIGNLTSLEVISATNNHLGGSIPYTIGQLEKLSEMAIGINQLHGTIPPSLYNLSLLSVIDIGGNQIAGSLPQDIGLKLPKLQFFLIWGNKFTGILPVSISNFSELAAIMAGGNRFHGKIAIDFGMMPNLFRVGLDVNAFGSGEPDELNFIASLVNCSNLQALDFGANKLIGKLPSCVGNLSTRLFRLALPYNQIYGFIPPSITNLVGLELLSLNHNQFTGTIPSNLGNLQKLLILDLEKNKLGGNIPKSVGNLTLLIELSLYNNRLTGTIPTNFGNCQKLILLDLSLNNLSGSIPRELLQLSSLSKSLNLARNHLEKFSFNYLNLSFNDFEGELPIEGVFTNATAISVTGNKRLCGGLPELQLPKCSIKNGKNGKKMSLALIIAIPIVSLLVSLALVSYLLLVWHKRRSTTHSSGLVLRQTFTKYSYEMLLKATNGFSSENLIGTGSFSSVFKGVLEEDGAEVAVKVLNPDILEALKSFMAECEAWRNIRHRNLVKIITACSSIDFQGNDFKALVYEFMPNGSLESWLHPTTGGQNRENENRENELHELSLLQRINIARDVAHAIDYLHHRCEIAIIHCDLKPSNILLDKDMVAHVGDFGLARFLLPEDSSINRSSSIGLRGTIGYAPPEYGLGSEMSTEGDVYSYGIFLLEMLTGKRPIDSMFNNGLSLHNYARAALPDYITEIVDPILVKEDENETRGLTYAKQKVECMVSLTKIGIACSVESAHDRMNISEVVAELQRVVNIIPQQEI